jgi:hypothetical protein
VLTKLARGIGLQDRGSRSSADAAGRGRALPGGSCSVNTHGVEGLATKNDERNRVLIPPSSPLMWMSLRCGS